MKKKVISVLLTTVMSAALLAGCGSSESAAPAAEEPAEEAAEEPTEEPAEETAEEPAAEESADAADADAPACKGALEGVSLVVGTSGTYAPFSYFAEDGTTLQGYDVDFLNALQEVLGFEIEGGEIQDMDYGPLGTSLSQGQLDIGAAALCATDERKKSMNFTDIYYDAGIIVAVAEDNETITSVDDLTGGVVI